MNGEAPFVGSDAFLAARGGGVNAVKNESARGRARGARVVPWGEATGLKIEGFATLELRSFR
jgi:hypothetical protein